MTKETKIIGRNVTSLIKLAREIKEAQFNTPRTEHIDGSGYSSVSRGKEFHFPRDLGKSDLEIYRQENKRLSDALGEIRKDVNFYKAEALKLAEALDHWKKIAKDATSSLHDQRKLTLSNFSLMEIEAELMRRLDISKK